MNDYGRPRAQPPELLSLPVELRLHIFRYLVLTEDKIYPQWENCWLREGLRRNILRTCSQLYEEASTILYEENTFAYRAEACAYGSHHFASFIYHKDLTRIKHLWLEIYETDTQITAKCVSSMLRHTLRIGCSLTTLELRFRFRSHRYIAPVFGCPPPPLSAYHDRSRFLDHLRGKFSIIQDICALKVQQSITVFVFTGEESDGEEMGGFVDAVAATTGWKKELQDHTTRTIDSDEKRYTQCFWTWVLRARKQPDGIGL